MARSHSMAVKPDRTVPLQLEVLARRRLSPSFVRITLGGGEIDAFTARGYDQWFRLFVPPEGADQLVLPRTDGYAGYAQLLVTKKDVRPTMRNYTVRAYRAATAERGAEIDVDFVLHEGPSGEIEGVAARWARDCRVGDQVGLLDEGHGYDPAEGASYHFLVTDETGLPAIAAICETLPADATGLVIIEIPHADDEQDFARPSGVEVRWLPRSEHPVDGHHRIGALAYSEAVAAAPSGTDGPIRHAYAVGEQALATGIRRLLVNERGWAKTEVSFCGYWRLPKGAPAIDQPHAAAGRAA